MTTDMITEVVVGYCRACCSPADHLLTNPDVRELLNNYANTSNSSYLHKLVLLCAKLRVFALSANF